MNEDHASQEMSLAENEPLLHQADPILLRAMNKYWDERPWHFVRKTGDIKTYEGVSRTIIGKQMDAQSKLPFMDH